MMIIIDEKNEKNTSIVKRRSGMNKHLFLFQYKMGMRVSFMYIWPQKINIDVVNFIIIVNV